MSGSGKSIVSRLGALAGKSILAAEHFFHKRGSSFPGKFVIKQFPSWLSTLAYPGTVVMVTGSSGKGSTTAIIAELLQRSGKTVCTNPEGSNMIQGIASTMVKHVTMDGRIPEDAMVLEVDERYLKVVTRYITPSLVIVNNVTRDQPPRHGHWELVAAEILKGIPASAILLVNGDDPVTVRLAERFRGRVRTFGIERNELSFVTLPTNVKDAVYCPHCGKHLSYQWVHYGSVGGFACPDCDFARKTPDDTVTALDVAHQTMTLNGALTLPVDATPLSHIYNLVCAYGAARILGLPADTTRDALQEQKLNPAIFSEIKTTTRRFVSLSCKAENNVTYNLAHIYTMQQPGKKVLVMGLKEISRRYAHYDLSWLYDLDMEILNRPEVERVICVGPYASPLAQRLALAGFPERKILQAETMDELPKLLAGTEGDVYGILNFDMVDAFVAQAKGFHDKTAMTGHCSAQHEASAEGVPVRLSDHVTVTKQIRIGYFYHDLCNLYGDSGNVRILEKTLTDQGFQVIVDRLTVEDPKEIDRYDMIYIGSATERGLLLALRDLRKYRAQLSKAIEDGTHILATGNAFELFGKELRRGKKVHQGLGLLDFSTLYGKRITEDIRLPVQPAFVSDRSESHPDSAVIRDFVGFENHAGTTVASTEKAFLDTPERQEGVVRNHFIGTYTIGPLLVRNPALLQAYAASITKEKG